MTFESIIAADDNTEQYIENGRIVSLKYISSELHLFIVKLVAGMGYYVNKRYYFEQIEKIARQDGLSDYAVGILIKHAAKKALLSYSKVSRLLPYTRKFNDGNSLHSVTTNNTTTIIPRHVGLPY